MSREHGPEIGSTDKGKHDAQLLHGDRSSDLPHNVIRHWVISQSTAVDASPIGTSKPVHRVLFIDCTADILKPLHRLDCIIKGKQSVDCSCHVGSK